MEKHVLVRSSLSIAFPSFVAWLLGFLALPLLLAFPSVRFVVCCLLFSSSSYVRKLSGMVVL